MTGSIEEFSAYIGQKTVVEELVTAAPVEKLAATFNRREPAPQLGDPLPPGWQGLFFRRQEYSDELLRDAAPVEMDDMPEPPLPVRMFGGNVMRFLKPLRIGDMARRERQLVKVTPKEGRTGNLVFAEFLSQYIGPQGIAIEEDHTLIFREDTSGGAKRSSPKGEPAPTGTAWEKPVEINEVTLFRYSALTFNSHRIHYDRTYVTEVEAYPDLVVHGPLIAQLLCDFARDNNPGKTMTEFSFQARAPLFVNRPVTLRGEPGDDGKSCSLWAVTGEGTITTQATAEFA